MSEQQPSGIAGRFLGIPIPAAEAPRLHLQVHGLDNSEIREIAQQAVMRGLSVRVQHLGAIADALEIADDSHNMLSIFAAPDSLAEGDWESERVPVEVGMSAAGAGDYPASAEVQLQQECDEGLAAASMVNAALAGEGHPDADPDCPSCHGSGFVLAGANAGSCAQRAWCHCTPIGKRARDKERSDETSIANAGLS